MNDCQNSACVPGVVIRGDYGETQGTRILHAFLGAGRERLHVGVSDSVGFGVCSFFLGLIDGCLLLLLFCFVFLLFQVDKVCVILGAEGGICVFVCACVGVCMCCVMCCVCVVLCVVCVMCV